MRNFTLPSPLDVLARGTSVLPDGRVQAQRGNHFITDRRRVGTEVGHRKKLADREPQRKREML